MTRRMENDGRHAAATPGRLVESVPQKQKDEPINQRKISKAKLPLPPVTGFLSIVITEYFRIHQNHLELESYTVNQLYCALKRSPENKFCTVDKTKIISTRYREMYCRVMCKILSKDGKRILRQLIDLKGTDKKCPADPEVQKSVFSGYWPRNMIL